MSQHDSLRKRTEQHKPKNLKSKIDDKDVYKSMEMLMQIIFHLFQCFLEKKNGLFRKCLKK